MTPPSLKTSSHNFTASMSAPCSSRRDFNLAMLSSGSTGKRATQQVSRCWRGHIRLIHQSPTPNMSGAPFVYPCGTFPLHVVLVLGDCDLWVIGGEASATGCDLYWHGPYSIRSGVHHERVFGRRKWHRHCPTINPCGIGRLSANLRNSGRPKQTVGAVSCLWVVGGGTVGWGLDPKHWL